MINTMRIALHRKALLRRKAMQYRTKFRMMMC